MIKAIALGSMALGAVAVGAAYVWSTSSVETPAYTVQVTNGDIELRNYPAMTLAQVTRSGSRRSAVQAGFSPLARYIFAKDRTGEKIAMTAPVVQSQLNDKWTVSFILPAAITADSAPTPASDVQVVSQPERLVAAIRFSGSWSDARFQNASQRLLAWVEEQGFGIDGAVEYGYYNDPFTPAFLRRNEVLVPVRARAFEEPLS